MAWSFKKTDKSKPAEILDTGWQFYFKPNNVERPGTIFRIDKNNVRYIVTHLPVVPDEGDEAFGKSLEKVEMNIGFFARLLGLTKLNFSATANIEKNFHLEFELRNSQRETTTDDALKVLLTPYLKELDFKADQRYFIIRETRKGSGIVYKLNKDLAGQLGGEAEILDAVAVKGNFVKMAKENDFELACDFEKPLRVMFLPEEIKPLYLNYSGDSMKLGTVPVKGPLYWEAEG